MIYLFPSNRYSSSALCLCVASSSWLHCAPWSSPGSGYPAWPSSAGLGCSPGSSYPTPILGSWSCSLALVPLLFFRTPRRYTDHHAPTAMRMRPRPTPRPIPADAPEESPPAPDAAPEAVLAPAPTAVEVLPVPPVPVPVTDAETILVLEAVDDYGQECFSTLLSNVYLPT